VVNDKTQFLSLFFLCLVEFEEPIIDHSIDSDNQFEEPIIDHTTEDNQFEDEIDPRSGALF
jgi:hypothetical protein